MSYMIDARLEQGKPSLTLIDASTGKKRLHWRGDRSMGKEVMWRDLFRKLMLVACADRLDLIDSIKSPGFGEECIQCSECSTQANSQSGQDIHELRAYK